jgi:hypothetical protein
MTTKIKVLLGIIAAQLGLLFFALSAREGGRGSQPAVSAFALAADSAQVDKIVLGANTLQRTPSGWTINGQHPADARLVGQLLGLLRKVEVKRPVPPTQRDSVARLLAARGIQVQVYAGGQPQTSYQALGLGPDTYAQTAGQPPVQLFLPGYHLDLHEVFALPAGEWRHKTLVATGFASVRALSVRYPQSPTDDFLIERDSGFYKVGGIGQLDSAMLVNYLGAYRSLQVAAFLDWPGLADSLQKAKPFAILQLQGISERNDLDLRVYVNQQRMLGLVGKTGEVVALEPRYFTRFLVRQRDFGQE